MPTSAVYPKKLAAIAGTRQAIYMKAFALSLSAFALFACGTSFGHIQGVTRIEVRDNQNRQLAVIENTQQIADVMQFVNARTGGWKVPWYGVPIPTLIANFYAERTLLGHFGAGVNFFECQRDGGFFSRSADASELLQFEKLVGSKRKRNDFPLTADR